jgi:hypothetical protein
MKALSCLCAAIAATVVSISGASAFNAPKAQITVVSNGIVKVSHHRHYRRGDLFSNWCAYNCYRVSRFARPPLGRYGYSQYAYDEDLPFPYRWDIDASPVDNALALPQYHIGTPLLRAGERRW